MPIKCPTDEQALAEAEKTEEAFDLLRPIVDRISRDRTFTVHHLLHALALHVIMVMLKHYPEVSALASYTNFYGGALAEIRLDNDGGLNEGGEDYFPRKNGKSEKPKPN